MKLDTNALKSKEDIIKNWAQCYGFTSCGIATSSFLESEANRLEEWLNKKQHGEMHYMEKHFEKRLDTRLLVPDSQSVISLMYNYFPQEKQREDSYKISKYAYGKDYHKVIKKKLKTLVNQLQEEFGDFHARIFVDSAPVLEKAWAVKSGLGWMGKNANVISKSKGSFFFLAEIICDLKLTPDAPITDYCGTCTKCIDACPTQAIEKPYSVNGSKCISYFTIELKDEIPDQFKNTFEDWMFGCDICQDVCPWNRFSKPTLEEKFAPKNAVLENSKEDWEALTEEEFQEIFEGSAVKRTKFQGLMRNINFLKKQDT